MRRTVNIGLVVIMILGAVVTYALKYQAEATADHLAELRRQVAEEQDALDYLKAEWSVLTQPGRLQELVALHQEELGLAPVEPDQIANFSEIPVRPAPEPPAVLPSWAGVPVEPTFTGAIAP